MAAASAAAMKQAHNMTTALQLLGAQLDIRLGTSQSTEILMNE